MKVLGIDFTSAPKGNKYITCLTCNLEDGVLSASAGDLHELRFDGFESTLVQTGPWIAGIDFPFGVLDGVAAELRRVIGESAEKAVDQDELRLAA